MKYLKLFEESEDVKKYWRIPIDDNFFIRLDKIGIPIPDQKRIYDHYVTNWKWENTFKNIFVSLDIEKDDVFVNWTGNRLNKTVSEDFEYNKYIRQDDVKITQKDIDDWHVKQAAKKYNL